MKTFLILLFLSSSLISFSQRLYINNLQKTGISWYYNEDRRYEPLSFVRDVKEKEINKKELSDTRKCVINTYESQIGVREKGTNSGKEVEMYLASVGLPKGNPWCASFVAWSFQQCSNINVKSGGWVPSWFPKNKLIFQRGKIDYIKPPQSGDLIGIWYQNKGRLAHIGFYQHEYEDFTISVEGNTNEDGSREGDGVYRKRRITRTIHSIANWLD